MVRPDRLLGLMAATLAFSGQSFGSVVAWYNFSDPSNPAVVTDNSGNGHTGAVSGAVYAAPNAGAPAFVSGAMTFNGGSDAVNLNVPGTNPGFANLTLNNAGTVGLWMYGDSSQPQQQSAFWADTGSNNRQFQAHTPWSDQTIYFDTGGCCSADTRLAQNDPNSADWKGQWNQWTFVKNGNDKNIYVNGNLFASQIGGATAPIGTIAQFAIGNTSTAPGQANGYHGQIADFVVFDTGLTASQVAQLFSQGAGSFVPEPSSLVLLGLGVVGLFIAASGRRMPVRF